MNACWAFSLDAWIFLIKKISKSVCHNFLLRLMERRRWGVVWAYIFCQRSYGLSSSKMYLGKKGGGGKVVDHPPNFSAKRGENNKSTCKQTKRERERERESLSLFPLFFQLLPAPPLFLQKGSNLASFSMLLFLSTMLGLFVCWPFLALPTRARILCLDSL